MNYFHSLIDLVPLLEAIALSIIFGCVSNYIIFKIIRKYYHPLVSTPATVILSALKRALYFIFPLFYFIFFSEIYNFTETSDYTEAVVKIVISIAFILTAIKFLDYIDVWLDRKKKTVKDSSHIGMLVTRVYLIKKILRAIIVLLGIALILLNFPDLQEFGKGVLVSAGIAGGIIAFASNKIFTNLFSGLEVIFNKPIQVGDVVKLEGESGTIEKITLNQIHFRTWDLRLIIYPLTYFIDNSFQNLSHVPEGLKGVVFIYTDYRLNIEDLRRVQTDILKASPLWNQKTNILQVLELNSNNVQLRAVVSAKNIDDLWNLQCYLREKMILYIQKTNQEILPTQKIQVNILDKISTRDSVSSLT